MNKQFITLLPFVASLLTACGGGGGGSNTPTASPRLSAHPNNGYYVGSASSIKTPLKTIAYGTIINGQVGINVINQEGVSFIHGSFQLNTDVCFQGTQASEQGPQPFMLRNCKYVNSNLQGSYKNDVSDDEGTINITLNTTQLSVLPTPNANYKGSATSTLTNFTSTVTGNIAAGGSSQFTVTSNNATIEGQFQASNAVCFVGKILNTDSPFSRQFNLISCSYQAGGAITGTYTSEFGDSGTFTIMPQ